MLTAPHKRISLYKQRWRAARENHFPLELELFGASDAEVAKDKFVYGVFIYLC